MKYLKVFWCLFAAQIVPCYMQGTQWSEEETWIIHDKLQTLMLSSDNVVDEYQKLHPKGPKYKKLMQPNPPKVKKEC